MKYEIVGEADLGLPALFLSSRAKIPKKPCKICILGLAFRFAHVYNRQGITHSRGWSRSSPLG